MKGFIVAVASMGLVGAYALAQPPNAGKAAGKASSELKDLKQKASYGIGVSIARQLKGSGMEVDSDVLARGIRDGLAGKPLVTDKEIGEFMQAYQQELLGKVKKEGEDFLAENKKKKGVTTLPSGLQYEVLKAGTGKQPKATDSVTVNYEGKLINGTVFDSSYKRGEPASFQVNGVIKGWTEALQLMKAGSKWRLYIPSELAYGASPRPGGPIRPHDPLVFEVELLDVK